MEVHTSRNEMSKLVIFVLSCVGLVQCTSLPTLRISPALTKLAILEGDKLELECVHTYRAGTTEMASFRKDDKDVLVNNDNGYVITTASSVSPNDPSVTITIKTLKKNATIEGDQGSFQCYIGNPNNPETLGSKIEVFIVKITHKDANLNTSLQSQSLVCELTGWKDGVKFSWKGVNDKDIVAGDKYQIFQNGTVVINGTLVINTPTRDDLGEYKCEVTFNPTSDTEKHVITPKPVALRGGPEIVSSDNSKNMVEGDKLELKCKATGFPKPTMKWYKDGKELNTTVRLHFSEYEGIATGKLIIFDLTYDDAGLYSCVAENIIAPNNSSKVMELRVKDKLAALWPFLGIVAEVVVLCVIILLYEKRRSKKLAEEDDAVDGTDETTPGDSKEVRHRRT